MENVPEISFPRLSLWSLPTIFCRSLKKSLFSGLLVLHNIPENSKKILQYFTKSSFIGLFFLAKCSPKFLEFFFSKNPLVGGYCALQNILLNSLKKYYLKVSFLRLLSLKNILDKSLKKKKSLSHWKKS